jgi:two-component system, chemotaxis family, CheB/CheR fusion protein
MNVMNVDQPNKVEPVRLETSLPSEPVEQTAGADEDTAQEFPIVGIGASAGGLAAFEQLFSNLPPDTGLAYVVIQHLSAPHKSILPEILQRFTAMPVVQVTDGIQVQPNCVYVIPPSNNLALMDGHLILLKPPTEHAYRFPIDLFFRSLAEGRGSSAIGIVLSGTASDGSLGIKNIKAMGGLTIAQDPDTAGFGDMPSNAIATHDVDFIVPPEQMGELILKYIHHQPTGEYRPGDGNLQRGFAPLQQLFSLLRSKTGHDFSLYKHNTILRRIERRIKLTLVPDLAAYIDYLRQHPEEIEAFFRDMLINVTQFFRDPEAFSALAEKVIQPLIVSKYAAEVPLRIWVAGCSTGEEAYSIAIAIQEQCEVLKADCKVQIYATDLDMEAIALARRGIYADGSLENVSPERLQRFFVKAEEGYQIKKSIRDLVVFSTQNLVFDAPFSKMDLLCCRNLLIYLEGELQKQVFPIFHYALNPGGFLFLGTSESVGSFTDLFGVIDRKNKIYQRKQAASRQLMHTRVRSAVGFPLSVDSETMKQHSGTKELREWTEQALLKFHAPTCVIVDAKHEILYIHGRTGKYLETPSGEVSTNILRMAREGLKAELATAIHAASANKDSVSRQGIRVKTNGDYQLIDLTVRPVDMVGVGQGLLMVVFEEARNLPVEPKSTDAKKPAKNRRVAELEKALKEKDEYLNSIINELEEANQDLKSTNEELQSSNEEMQSTNEEMETSREELQSINEELSTVNAELQSKNAELTGLNNDVYNLLASTEIGTIFLDLEMQVRRYTPAIRSIYNFLPGDIGRPISHFLSTLLYDHLIEDIREVLSTLIPKSIEAQSKDDVWYLINIKPYRTLENVIDGAVITFVDITRQKQSEALQRLATVVRDANDAITIQDFDGNIQAWNQGAVQLYGWRETEALKMNVLDLVPEQLRAEHKALYQRLFKGEKIRSFETKRLTRSGSTVDVWVTLSLLVNDMNQPVGIATTERDITDRKLSDQRLRFEIRALKILNAWLTRYDGQKFPPAQWNEVCQMLVDEGGYRLAWIGQVEEGQTGSLLPVGWSETVENSSISEKAIRTLARRSQKLAESTLQNHSPKVIREILGNQSYQSLITDALKYEYNSLIVLPLALESRSLGVLFIYAAEPEAFVEQEMSSLVLLSERITAKLRAG